MIEGMVPAAPASPDMLPLAGLRVVAVEQAVAAPLATRHLADLGADVVKIERPHEGDFARHYDTAVHGLASHFIWLNRSKRSVAIDLKTPEGAELVRRLASSADVFVQNLAPGAAERMGLGAPALRELNPRLVVVNMSGYGTSGPHAQRKAYDMLVQAETGLVSVTGTQESATKTGIPTADIAAGMYAFGAAVSALLRRERTGEGATIDVSMFDATAEWLGHQMYVQLYAGRQVPRMGLSHAAIAPYDAYPTKDGQVLIGVQNDRGWRALAVEVFGRPELVDDPRFCTNVQRVRHRSECDAVVGSLSKGWLTAELEDRLAQAGVPAAQLNDISGLVAHPQLSARDRWREVGTEAGPVQALLPPMTFRDVELRMGDVPGLGAHTDEVLAEAGVTPEQVAGLRRDGVLQ